MADGQNLLKYQGNEMFEAIRSAGLDPSAFRWSLSETGTIECLLYGQGSYFRIQPTPPRFECWYSPGSESIRSHALPGNWTHTLARFEQWLKFLKREEDTLDLWATLGPESDLVTGVRSGDDNSPFSEEEQKRISDAIEEIQRQLAGTGAFTAVQLEGVTSRLDETREASTRLGRKDWKIYVLGIVTDIVLHYGLTGDTAKEVFRITGELLKWVFHTTLLLS